MVPQGVRKYFFTVFLNRFVCNFFDRYRPPRNFGDRGERIAERHLLRLGYYIVGRNHRSRYGEIDLIAVDEKTVVFVEVKARASNIAGYAAEAVDDQKEVKISKTAAEYVHYRGLHDSRKRFDVVAIDFEGKSWKLRHFRNAFESAIDD